MKLRQAIINHFNSNGWPTAYIHHLPDLPRSGSHALILSPFRTETRPSFRIDYEGQYAGRWIDSGTRETGDYFDFCARRYNLNVKTQFPELCRRIIEEHHIPVPSEQSGRRKRVNKSKDPGAVVLELTNALDDSAIYKDLVERRGLKPEVIRKHQLGNYKDQIAIPFLNQHGEIIGYKIHKGKHLKPDGTVAPKGQGVKAQLYPGRPSEESTEIWIAGGELDALRLESEGKIAVSSSAGETSWKSEWTDWFSKKDVVIVYDNDDAGQTGQKSLIRILKGRATRLRVVDWPKGLSKGFDITDWLLSGKKLDDLPLHEIKVKRTSLKSAKETIQNWLHLDPGEEILVDIVLGTVVANRFSGDPVWLFLVGAPGIIKTELLRTLSEWNEVYVLSTLTSSTLISGYSPKDGTDPSLLPKLDGLVLIIKDFTAVLDMQRDARQQIMGELRDAYDGQMSKAFGSEAGTRSYESKFGIMAAVTPAIDKHWTVSQQLGERFLKFRIRSTNTVSRITRAVQNSGREKEMRKALSEAMEGVLYGCEVHDEESIQISEHVLENLIQLADCLAVMRSAVARDGYSKAIQFTPEPEVGTRLVKQFAKFARGVAAVREKARVETDEYQLVRRLARDTLPSKRRELIQTVYQLFARGHLPTQDIAIECNMPTETIKLDLEDLWVLNLVDRQGQGRFTWKMNDTFKKRLDDLGFFNEASSVVSRDEMSGGNVSNSTAITHDELTKLTEPPDISSPQIQQTELLIDHKSSETGNDTPEKRETWKI